MGELTVMEATNQALPGVAPAPEAEAPKARVVASIVTVNLNHWHQLLEYLPSVLRAEGSFEVIISDNGSTDGSLEALRAQYKDIVLLENGENLGFAEACNRGAAHARGEFIIFLNPDTTVERDWLVRLLEPFRDPQVGLVTPKILLLREPDRINTCGNVIHISGIAQCRGIGQPRSKLSKAEEVDAVSGAAFAIRRTLFEELLGFDKDFFLYVEETDLSLRARIAGWKCVYQPESIVYHDYRLKFGPRKVFQQERNRYLTLLKNYSWSTLIRLLPVLLAAEVVTWGFSVITGVTNMGNKLQAYWWIIANWPLISSKHRAVQRIRRVRDREILAHCPSEINFRQVTNIGLARIAEGIFNPAFAILKAVLLALMR